MRKTAIINNKPHLIAIFLTFLNFYCQFKALCITKHKSITLCFFLKLLVLIALLIMQKNARVFEFLKQLFKPQYKSSKKKKHLIKKNISI